MIQLPLHQPELERFWRLASPSAMDSLSTLTHLSFPQQEFQNTNPSLYTVRLSGVLHQYSHHTNDWLREFGIIPGPNSLGGSPYKRLCKEYNELKDIACDLSSILLAEPRYDDMVYAIASLSFCSRLTATSSIGKGRSSALYVCRYTRNVQG